MSRIKIGWAKQEYSMENPVAINGQNYQRISRGILDPLYATALTLEGDDGVVIMVSMDITGIRYNLINEIFDEVKKLDSTVPTEHVVFNATHSHTSPALFKVDEKGLDGTPLMQRDDVHAYIATRVAKAIVNSWNSRKEGGIAFGYGYAVVGHSRRATFSVDMGAKKDPTTLSFNGHVVMYGKTTQPEFWGYEAGGDHFLNVMFTFDENNKLTGIVPNVPCPSQVSESMCMLSADYWCEVRESVAKQYGSDVFVLPQCAAAGDLSPRILHYKNAQHRRFALKFDNFQYDRTKTKNKANDENYINMCKAMRADIAERIMEGINEVYSWAKKDIQTDIPVYHTCKAVDLERSHIPDEDVALAKENLEALKSLAPNENDFESADEYRIAYGRYKNAISRNEGLIERYEDTKVNPTISTLIHTIRVGEIAFATNRFELYMDYMHRIQARSPFIQTFIVQLAGDEGCSYLPTKRGSENKGYGGSPFTTRVGFEGGAQLVEATLDMLEDLANK